MRAVTLFMCASLTLASTACSDAGSNADDEAPGDSIAIVNDGTTRDTLGRSIGAGPRPATMNGWLVVAGDSQLVSMQIFTPPASFPLKLSTYHPADMQVASASIGSVASVTFTPMFDGKTDPNAFIQFQTDVTPLAANDPAGAALSALTQGTDASRLDTDEIDRYPWATQAKSFRLTSGERKLAGTVIVGERAGRSYVFFIQHPEELAEAMAPRVALILRQWRWEDDFTYLVR